MDNQIEAIAKAFAATIREACADLDKENRDNVACEPLIETINATNSLSENAAFCATHDYFDANIGMGEAFFRVMKRESDVASEADAALWNAAWSFAKANQFWPVQASVWQLADDTAEYGANAGKFILTSPDGETELSDGSFFDTATDAASFANGRGFRVVPLDQA